MKPKPIDTGEAQPDLVALSHAICDSKYFEKIAPEVMANILRQGSIRELEKDAVLIREGDTSPSELYILVTGSLAVMSRGEFILRLDLPGDVVGEMAVIQSAPRSADVIAETDCRLMAFPARLFQIDENSRHASILYVLFSHILATKLRITTAQSLIRKNQRIATKNETKIGIIDAHPADRASISEIIQADWPEASVIEIEDPEHFADHPTAHRFDLIIADVGSAEGSLQDRAATASILRAMHWHGAYIFLLGQYCNDPADRKFLIEQGVNEVMGKPYTAFDLRHAIARFRVGHYKNMELDEAENAADTDRLTGVANRRRLDEFLHALVTVYSGGKQPFSLLILDVDNFKHYNDQHGHQMGDVVLQGVAAILAKNVRRGDLVARFGGEEFVIVVPDCDKAKALKLAEKLRAVVASEVFPNQQRQPSGNLTATLGVATFPEDGLDVEALLKQADDRLYHGKRSGKNRVIAA
jgi:diguanylate cyclase (GGDEF)-like protein